MGTEIQGYRCISYLEVCRISHRHSTGVGQVRSNSPCGGRMSIYVSETGTLRHASGRALNLRGWPLSISEDYNARLLVDPNNRRSERGLRHSVTELEPWNTKREQEKSTAVLRNFFAFIRFLTELVWWYLPQRSTNHIDTKASPQPALQANSGAPPKAPCLAQTCQENLRQSNFLISNQEASLSEFPGEHQGDWGPLVLGAVWPQLPPRTTVVPLGFPGLLVLVKAANSPSSLQPIMNGGSQVFATD